MNFNVEIDDQLGEKLTDIAKVRNKSRDEIIREAVSLWLTVNEKSEWSNEVLAFKGGPDFPAFESHREGLCEVEGDFFELEDEVTPDFMSERVDPLAQERELF